jgi:hypothetical protein
MLGSRRDEIIDVVADNDCEALTEYRRIWQRARGTTDVSNGWLFERRGRLIFRTTTAHDFNE